MPVRSLTTPKVVNRETEFKIAPERDHDLGDSGVRVFQGSYRGADGSTHHGTFVFILIDFYDPGSRLHEFNGGIAASGCAGRSGCPKAR